MADKMAEVLEQYGIVAASIQRSRGAFLCREGDRVYRLELFAGSEGRLLREHAVKEQLYQAGFTRIDRYRLLVEEDTQSTDMADRFLAADRYRNAYVLKEYFDGRECELQNMQDVRLAMENLGQLHSVGRGLAKEQNPALAAGTARTFAKHNRELCRVRGYVRRRTRKNEFERRFLEVTDLFMEQAEQAQRILDRLQVHKHEKWFGLCHGAYHHHHILITPQGVATVQFAQWHYDNQLTDLYCFLRKLLEKNDFSYTCFSEALDTYENTQALEAQDYCYLYLQLLYPEKFWKLSNHYMNANKAWIPPKTIEKLESLLGMEQKKQEFLKTFARERGIVPE